MASQIRPDATPALNAIVNVVCSPVIAVSYPSLDITYATTNQLKVQRILQLTLTAQARQIN
jgi:hypothetical protein